MLIAFAGIMWMNHQTGTIENELTDRHPISILLPFYDAASQPLTQQGIFGCGEYSYHGSGVLPCCKTADSTKAYRATD